MHDLTFAFVGAGGDGAVTAGDIIAGVCASEGLHVIKTEAYGPQIRGGESSATIRVSSERIYAQADAVVMGPPDVARETGRAVNMASRQRSMVTGAFFRLRAMRLL